jgi:PHD/YefM family antitoxin component YafN of YafNO toxin-antitoxin module
MTDGSDFAAADDGDETSYWLLIPGLRESLTEADGDYAAGRTHGEQEIRARFGLPPRYAR